MENRIVLDKYVLLEKHTDLVKQVIYCDKDPEIRYANVTGYFCALSLVELKHCCVSGVIEKYRHHMKTCCDLLYNITRDKIVSLQDNKNYFGDEVLCIYFSNRHKYSTLCRYNDNYVEPVIECLDDKFIISY